MMQISPIEFPVRVNGLSMTARVLEEIIPPYLFTYRIRFSNGFEDLFSIGDAGVAGEKINSGPYADAIRDDIGYVPGVDPDRFYHIFQETIDGMITNVWVIERETAERVSYAVYYNRFYRFELSRVDDKWEPSTTAKIYPNINFTLATKVGYLLDTFLPV
jgi:hypothetical protein